MSIQETVKEKFQAVPESKAGQHWLFWLSLAAVTLTVVSAARSAVK